jgi:coenzyme F420-0:L-glutamate ligase/coenzyme F420-1:gamma-L-glutamate ligase
VAPGTVLILPADPDASARTLRAALGARTGRRVGVVLSDTLGRPWRQGQADAAIGAAGVLVVDDLRGGTDSYGNPLEATMRAVADEIAALADLVKGKLGGIPAAVLRGLPDLVTDEDGPGAAALLRPGDQDWFRLGHVEAVRAALGAPPGTAAVPPRPVEPGTAVRRLRRAVRIALAAQDGPVSVEVTPADDAATDDADADTDADTDTDDDTDDTASDTACARLTVTTPTASALVTLGMTAQRLLAAAWSEDLDATLTPLDATPTVTGLTIRARSRPT